MDEAVIRQRVEAAGQAHVFERWDDLDAAQREALLGQLAALDFDALARRIELIQAKSEPPPPPEPLDPSFSAGLARKVDGWLLTEPTAPHPAVPASFWDSRVPTPAHGLPA